MISIKSVPGEGEGGKVWDRERGSQRGCSFDV